MSAVEPVTTPLLHGPRAVAEKMFGDASREDFVARRMSSRRWPSRKVGRGRFMTDSDILAAIEIEAVAAVAAPGPRPSGLSPRSRSKRAS